MKNYLESLGFKVESKKDISVTIAGTLTQTLQLYNERDQAPWGQIKPRLDRTYWGDSFNVFAQGTRQQLERELNGDIDMEPFIAARERLNRSGLIAALKTVTEDSAPKRRRVMSEHDGELDYDRRFDIAPFSSATRIKSAGRVITIRANFSISAGESAENITQYGATVWALSDIIEKAGIPTRVLFHMPFNLHHHERNPKADIQIELKAPGQYMAPSILASTMTGNFYRRIGFALKAAAYKIQGTEADSAGCISWPKRIEFTQGELRVSPQIWHASAARAGCKVDVEDLVREITKAIGVKPAIPVAV